MSDEDRVLAALKKLEKKGLMGRFLTYLLSDDEDPSPFPTEDRPRCAVHKGFVEDCCGSS